MSDPLDPRLSRLPGWELIVQGLADLANGHVTSAACLVCMAAPRLQRAGLVTSGVLSQRIVDPELQLYRLLRLEPGNSFGRYQALLRRLVRFEHALDRELCRRKGRQDKLAIAEQGD